MHTLIKNIIVSFIVSFIVLLVAFNIPADNLSVEKILTTDKLGIAALTDITSSDTVADFPTVQNANNTLLETAINTIEGTTTMSLVTSVPNLITVGTITTGTWNASILTASFGGTGSTTLSTGGVLYGNGTGIVSGTGACSDGETIQWSSSIPVCISATLDVSANFNWTGLHDFAATTSFATTTQHGVEGGLSPVGSINAYASTTAPAGWLLADGTSYLTATYPDLFAVLGYSYGGSGANFNVPDVQNRNIIMASTTANIGNTGGEANHTMTQAELVAHTHAVEANSGPTGVLAGSTVGGGDGGAITGSTGGGNPFNVLDPYIVLNYIIKY